MAEGIASNLVTGVLGKLGPALWDEIGLLRSFKDDADDLRSNFSAIQAVLLDAEELSSAGKESHALRDWLRKLKDAAYDADDLLDEIRTQAALRRQQHPEVQNQNQPAQKVREFLSHANPMHLMSKGEMAHRMKALRGKIDKITKEKDAFGLAKGSTVRQAEFKRPDTYSFVNEKRIVGRDGDKEKIVKLLLKTNSDHDVSVIPIVGLGGLGKTTLAQLAYNDERVKGEQCFDLRVWVCVSTDFHMKTIAKPVISAARQKCDDLANMDTVTRHLVKNCDDLDDMDTVVTCLVKIFSQMRCLLVLDDVWNEDKEKWEKLKDLFKDSKQGSKILVTTRSEKVADIMRTVEPHRVKGLSDDDCWTLFKRRAFEEGEENYYPSLVEIGKQIVKKCGGLPLAAITLGSMMPRKSGMGDESRRMDAWITIRDSEIWKLEEKDEKNRNILPSLKLSYIQMPSALKQCFAYCSIFPKDYEIDKDDLIRQWIALGFISLHETRTSMEHIGDEYFKDLLWMSFLQDVKENNRGVTSCRMHDLVHDLAQFVAREEVAVIGAEEESARIPEGCRYVSIYGSFTSQVSSTVMRRLRALQFRESGSLMTLCSEAKCLRLLDLHDSKISMLPSSVGKLKLLRYLDLSGTSIQEMPEAITGLCNLQTLNLSGCDMICTLPKSLGRLVNLRNLDLSNCQSLTILDSISNLQNLYALNLSLCENVMSLEPICHLKNLHYLDLERLNSLVTLPESIGSLQNLRVLNLSRCFSRKWLPLLLCHLKNLHYLDLSCLYSLVALPKSIGSLQNLRILNLSHCNSLESLPSSSSDLQRLEKLDISDCRKLCELPKMIQKLTKLRVLLNNNCWELKGMPRGIGKLLSLQELSVFVVGKQDRVEHCASISELEHLKLVGELEIKGLENVTSPVDAEAANLIEKKLRSLKLVWNVLSAEEGTYSTVLPAEEIETVLENLQPHQRLENLEIEGYGGGKFPSWMMNGICSCLPNLFQIELANIPGCSAFPPLGQLPFLKQLTIRNMPTITNLGVDKFPALTRLELSSMPGLREWVTVLTVDDEEGSPNRVPIFSCLTDLSLTECPQLRPEPCLPASVEKLRICRTSKENLSLILERATPPNKGLRDLTIGECQKLTCLPESLRSLTSLRSLRIWYCKDLERIEDWLGELTGLESLSIRRCNSLRYLPAHKMTALKQLNISTWPLLLDAGGQFVDTTVDHIKNVEVNGRPYPYEELASSSSKEESSPKLLRYLDLSSTNIQELPKAITSHCNLQKLNLSRCRKIRTLPKFLGRLTNLRTLDLSWCSSLTILDSVSNLQNLYSLNLSRCENVRSLEPICHLKNLHYLDLSCLYSLVALPKSIGSLQNLRILNLSCCNSLESLPSSSSDLQRLEKLDISGCGKLCELPKMIQKLTKLGVLLNNNCSELKGMARGIGKLVSLQELSVFVVGKQDRVEHCASISELEHLKLVGELEIKGLENVTSPVDAKAANLIEKNLQSLKLVWNVLSAEEGMDTVLPAEEMEEMDTVIENLQPHQELKKLEIEGYGAGKFPSWMMNRIGSCLPNLVQIKLHNMPGCSSLPPLGQLPFLKKLQIGDMPAITNLGVDKFPALTRLELSSMPVLREWVTVLTVDDEEGRRERVPVFPRLTHLLLKECPQLSPEPCLLASVEDLTISGTSKENLSLILERATPLDGGSDAADSHQPTPNKGLGDLSIKKHQQLTCLPESLRSLTSLQRLTIDDCEDLEGIEDWLGELTDLQSLHITKCSSLRYLPAHKMIALKQLHIKECPQLRPETCLPVSVEDLTISRTSSENLSLILERATPLDGGDAADSLQPPPNKGLRRLTIDECQQLTCLPESLRGLTSLQSLNIWDCEDLERIEDWLGELTELRSLSIGNCSSLHYLPVHKMTALKQLNIGDCPLLLDAGGQFVGTSVDHIEEVYVDGRQYKYKKQVSNSPKEEKKSWTNRWRRA